MKQLLIIIVPLIPWLPFFTMPVAAKRDRWSVTSRAHLIWLLFALGIVIELGYGVWVLFTVNADLPLRVFSVALFWVVVNGLNFWSLGAALSMLYFPDHAFCMEYTRRINPPRLLTIDERKLLDFLLEERFRGRDKLREQLGSAMVSGECECGCQSIELSVERSPDIRARVKGRIPVGARGTDMDGTLLHIYLEVKRGYLLGLELVRDDFMRQPISLPDPERLEVVHFGEQPTLVGSLKSGLFPRNKRK